MTQWQGEQQRPAPRLKGPSHLVGGISWGEDSQVDEVWNTLTAVLRVNFGVLKRIQTTVY